MKVELSGKEIECIIEGLKKFFTPTELELLDRLKTENRTDALRYDGFTKRVFDSLKKKKVIQIVNGRIYDSFGESVPYELLRDFQRIKMIDSRGK